MPTKGRRVPLCPKSNSYWYFIKKVRLFYLLRVKEPLYVRASLVNSQRSLYEEKLYNYRQTRFWQLLTHNECWGLIGQNIAV